MSLARGLNAVLNKGKQVTSPHFVHAVCLEFQRADRNSESSRSVPQACWKMEMTVVLIEGDRHFIANVLQNPIVQSPP